MNARSRRRPAGPDNSTPTAKLADAVARLGGRAQAVPMDLGDAAAAQAIFEQIGADDHFVSTAADLTYGPLATVERPAIERMLAGKFWGPVNLVQFGVQNLRASGSILLFSGLAADRPAAGSVGLEWALNAGVEGLVRALAVELAPVRVNGISPGVVETEGWAFMDEGSRKGFFSDLATKLLARRIGTPRDLAEAALFALTNRYPTGGVVHVHGGGSLS
ncbi:MAG: SDR family oxidoreductase [Hydrogenophaga sp.]|uniref:SDR family oxidoreductase n=1 Tax=Hydrogenophaga sp. TaxID=1904254 RepID=UPI0025C6D67B|nr:SDR family oxidoreductase [Hydrogenophaga sp.]MBT9550376.1 SDR family oxidoreductase [Hydrogenophaga sp.]